MEIQLFIFLFVIIACVVLAFIFWDKIMCMIDPVCSTKTALTAAGDLVKDVGNEIGEAIEDAATADRSGGIADKSSGRSSASKLSHYDSFKVKDVEGNDVNLTLKNNTIDCVIDAWIFSYCPNVDKNDSKALTDAQWKKIENVRYYGELPKKVDGKTYSYDLKQMSRNKTDHKQSRDCNVYAGGQVDFHIGIQGTAGLITVGVVIAVVATAGAVAYAAPAAAAGATGAAAAAGTAATTAATTAGAAAISALTAAGLSATVATAVVVTASAAALAATTAAATRAAIKGGPGTAAGKLSMDSQAYSSDRILLYRIKKIEYERELGCKGNYVVKERNRQKILLYQPYESGMLKPRMRIQKVDDPKVQVKYFGNEDGWIMHPDIRAGLHKVWAKKTKVENLISKSSLNENQKKQLSEAAKTGLFTTDVELQEYISCAYISDMVHPKIFGKLPKSKRFRLDKCVKSAPKGRTGGQIGEQVPRFAQVCKPNLSVFNDEKDREAFCAPLQKAANNVIDENNLFYYPGATEGGRDSSNCVGAYRYALALNGLPNVCKEYGFHNPLRFFLQRGSKFLRKNKSNNDVYMYDLSDGKDVAFTIEYMDIVSGIWNEVISDDFLMNKDQNNELVIRFVQNDDYLTHNTEKSTRGSMFLKDLTTDKSKSQTFVIIHDGEVQKDRNLIRIMDGNFNKDKNKIYLQWKDDKEFVFVTQKSQASYFLLSQFQGTFEVEKPESYIIKLNDQHLRENKSNDDVYMYDTSDGEKVVFNIEIYNEKLGWMPFTNQNLNSTTVRFVKGEYLLTRNKEKSTRGSLFLTKSKYSENDKKYTQKFKVFKSSNKYQLQDQSNNEYLYWKDNKEFSFTNSKNNATKFSFTKET